MIPTIRQIITDWIFNGLSNKQAARWLKEHFRLWSEKE